MTGATALCWVCGKDGAVQTSDGSWLCADHAPAVEVTQGRDDAAAMAALKAWAQADYPNRWYEVWSDGEETEVCLGYHGSEAEWKALEDDLSVAAAQALGAATSELEQGTDTEGDSA